MNNKQHIYTKYTEKLSSIELTLDLWGLVFTDKNISDFYASMDELCK